jgi:hypothetical protein
MDEEVTDTRYTVGSGNYEFGFTHTVYPIRGSTPAHSTIHVMLGPAGVRRLDAGDAVSGGFYALVLIVLLIIAFMTARKKYSNPTH